MKLSPFRKFLYIFWGSLAVLLGVILIVVSSFLTAYEKSLPDTAVDGWISAQGKEEWCRLFEETVSEHVGKYETSRQAAEYLYENLVLTRDIYAVNDETTDERLAFTVYSGKYAIAELIFERGPELGFGMYSWVISEEKALSEVPDCLFCDVTVTVKKGQCVSVNGEALTSPDSVASPSLSLWEQSYADKYPCDRYSLGKMWSSPSVQIDGEDASPDASGNFISDYTLTEIGTVTLSVPKGAEVYCNDVLVSEAHIVSEEPFTAVSVYDTGTYSLQTYEINGLCFEPAVTVLYDGEVLAPSETNPYEYPYPYRDIYVIAPEGYQPIVNGRKVNADATEYTVPVLEEVAKRLTGSVRFMKYSLGNMVQEVEMNIEELTETDGVYYAAASEEDSVRVQNAAYDFILTFVDYSAKAVKGDTLKSYTLYGSQAYKLLGTIENGMQYNAAYTRTFFSGSVSDVARFADNGFVCTVEYVAVLKRNAGVSARFPEEKTLQSTYRLYILFEKGKGYVFRMDLLGE